MTYKYPIINKLANKFRKSEFFKNATILSSGTAVSQFISIFTAPILTRIYRPEDYGLLGVYMVFTALVATFSTMQFHNAIVTAENDEIAKNVLGLSLILNVITAVILIIVVLIASPWISKVYNSSGLKNWLILAPLSIFFIGINNTFSAWAIRKKSFKILSYNKITTAMLSPVLSIILGFLILGPFGLFIGLLLSQTIPTVRMSYYFLKVDSLNLKFHRHDLKAVFRKFKNFPLFSLPAEFINNLSNQIPIMILSRTGGMNVIGLYNLSVRMLGLPSTLVSASIADVFRQRATQDYFTKGSCRGIFMKVFKTLLLISLPPLLVVVLFGPQLFSFVFGSNWKEAGSIAQIIAILYAFKFVVSPLSYTTYIANKQWVGLLIDIILLIVLGSVLYISQVYNMSYKTSLWIFVFCYCTLYFLTFYLSYKFTINEKFTPEN